MPNLFRTLIGPQNVNDTCLRNRMKLCLVAIGLMWLTTLQNAVYLSSIVIPVPDFNTTVYSICSMTFQLLKQEEENYAKCTKYQVETCNNTFHKKVNFEKQRVQTSQEYNKNILHTAEVIDIECFESLSNMRHSLQIYTDLGHSLPYRNYSAIKHPKRQGLSLCSVEDRQILHSMVGDLSSLRSAAFDISEKFSFDTLSTFEEFLEFSKQRIQYDRSYINNHTSETRKRIKDQINSVANLAVLQDFDSNLEQLIDATHELVQCISPRGVNHGHCHDFEGMQVQFSKILQLGNSRLQHYENMFVDNMKKMKQYKINAYNAYLKFKRFYDGKCNYFSFLDNKNGRMVTNWTFTILHLNQGVNQMFEHFPLIRKSLIVNPLSDFYPIDVQFPSKPSLPNLPSMDSVWKSVSPSLGTYEQQIEDIIQRLRDAELKQIDFIKNISLNVNIIPDIYNVPQFNVSWELDKFRERNLEFLDRSSLALQAFSEFDTSKIEKVTQPVYKFINTSQHKMKSLFSNIDVMNFEPLSVPDFIDLDFWLLSLTNIQGYFFLVDYVYRIYNCGRLINKYWSAGSVKLPVVDIRAYSNDQGIGRRLRVDPRRTIFMLFVANPFIGMAMMGLLFISCVSLLAAIYAPLYSDYVNGCVKMPEQQMLNNNIATTFLSMNLYSISYNYISHKGDNIKTKGITYLNDKNQELCTKFFDSSILQQNEDIDKYARLMNAYNQTSIDMNIFNNCLDIKKLDRKFQEFCCDLQGYKGCYNFKKQSSANDGANCPMNQLVSPPIPFSSPEYYISDKSCTKSYNARENHYKDLKDAIFNCDNIKPTCSLTCKNRSNKDRIKLATSKCSCTVEWYLHSIILQCSITVFIFIVINVARNMLCVGLCNVLWKYLHPPYLTVKASTCMNGDVINPNDEDISKYFLPNNNGINENNSITSDTLVNDEITTIDQDSDDDDDDDNYLRRHSNYCTKESEQEENDDGVKEVINKQIQKILFRFMIKGCMMIIASITIIVLLIVLLFRISHSIIPTHWI